MTLKITEQPVSSLAQYGQIPIAFEVREILDVVATRHEPGGLRLVPRALAEPYMKDYDAELANRPTQWAARFDLSHWGFLIAMLDGEHVGGAAIAWDCPQVDLLESRSHLAILWDLRVAPAARRQGVGTALFNEAERWAAARGARMLKVETQNVNVAACSFYAAHGCTLGAIDRFAYADLPDEAQLLWYKNIE